MDYLICAALLRESPHIPDTTARSETVIQSSETRLRDGETGCGSGRIKTSAAFGYFPFSHFFKKANKH